MTFLLYTSKALKNINQKNIKKFSKKEYFLFIKSIKKYKFYFLRKLKKYLKSLSFVKLKNHGTKKNFKFNK